MSTADAAALSGVIGAAALVVLVVVALSGLGPVRSLRRTTERLDEVRDEADRLRRNVDVLQRRRAEIERHGREDRP